MSSLHTDQDLDPSLRLVMPAVAPNVSLVRQVISGVTDALLIDAGQSADMKIAVTEATTNVVMHAYPDGEGQAEVTFTTLPEYVVVSVRDRGVGFKPMSPANVYVDPDGTQTHGWGLTLIGSLSDEFAIMSGSAGTEVQMLFTLGDQPAPDAARIFAGTSQLVASPAGESASDGADPGLSLAIGRGEPVAPVLGRMVALLCARAGFSIDRLSDAQLVSDLLARHAPRHLNGDVLSVVVDEQDGAFELAVGPLARGGADAVLGAASLPGVGSLIEPLADDVSVQPAGTGEQLRLRLARR